MATTLATGTPWDEVGGDGEIREPFSGTGGLCKLYLGSLEGVGGQRSTRMALFGRVLLLLEVLPWSWLIELGVSLLLLLSCCFLFSCLRLRLRSLSSSSPDHEEQLQEETEGDA